MCLFPEIKISNSDYYCVRAVGVIPCLYPVWLVGAGRGGLVYFRVQSSNSAPVLGGSCLRKTSDQISNDVYYLKTKHFFCFISGLRMLTLKITEILLWSVNKMDCRESCLYVILTCWPPFEKFICCQSSENFCF